LEDKPVRSYVSKNHCQTINLGSSNEEKTIQITNRLSPFELATWVKFFKENSQTFAWSYKDLKGVSPSICQHHIDIEARAKPIRQGPIV